ncbi:MAG: response regulator [Candidatus Peribacteraceae bacterium]|jgi:two-component system phosphate regulon response regulator PhoB|nr:response regulator [Candidatus Peribacteria bacterium]
MQSKGNILFAEDDPVLREVFKKKFTIEGYEVRTSANGDEALAALSQQLPDALLLDINMPGKNGFDVMEQYPRDKRSFPIIILTNLGDEHTRRRGEELGADGFFIKSQMTVKMLIEMVNDLRKQQ